MVDRVCGRCRTVGICRFVDLVIQRTVFEKSSARCSQASAARVLARARYATLARPQGGIAKIDCTAVATYGRPLAVLGLSHYCPRATFKLSTRGQSHFPPSRCLALGPSVAHPRPAEGSSIGLVQSLRFSSAASWSSASLARRS